jgi:glycine oxidase
VYIVPRSDGRLIIGSTVEDVGFDKRLDADTIHALDDNACYLLPQLAQARMLETWAGLRPGTPDGLPIIGATSIDGYFVATGHFRDGILLAPITAELMVRIIRKLPAEIDIAPLSPERFAL